MTDTVLTDDQIASFVEHGHVTLSGCFTREDAQPLPDEAWIRSGSATGRRPRARASSPSVCCDSSA